MIGGTYDVPESPISTGVRPGILTTQITGLIGFDIGAGFRTCDPSCSDS